MKIWYMTLLLVISLSLGAFAKNPLSTKKSRARKSVESSPITFKVVYGDQLTNFRISKTTDGGLIDFSNSSGLLRSKKISKADYDHLLKKTSDYPGNSNQLKFCTRNHIEMQSGSRRVASCMGSSTKLAEEMLETINLMSLVL